MCRYTSYGRHFTTKQKLIIVNSVLLPLLLEDDMAVDSSCGANEWVPDLRAACLRVREFTVRPASRYRSNLYRSSMCCSYSCLPACPEADNVSEVHGLACRGSMQSKCSNRVVGQSC